MHTNKREKILTIDEFSRRVIDAIPELVRYEIQPGGVVFHFDQPRLLPGIDTPQRNTLFTFDERPISEASVAFVVQRIRGMLNDKTGTSAPMAWRRDPNTTPKK